MALLAVADLTVELASSSGPATVLRRVGFTLERGRILGVVGESAEHCLLSYRGSRFGCAIASDTGSEVRPGGASFLLLILDLGTPSRFMNMMRHFKFWDPMSIGAWMLGVFGLFAFVSSALSLVGGEGVAPVRRVVSLVGTIAGFFIAAYTGVLLSATALPLWREARLMGALFLASGASTGMAAISLLLYLAGESAGEGFKKIKRADRYAIMFEILVLAAFVFLLGSAAGPLVTGQLAPLFWGGLVAVGLVLPLLVDVTGLKVPGAIPAAR